MGADVVRIDRPSHQRPNARAELLLRGRRSVAIDLKRREGVDVLLRLLDEADALIDPFRPGVAERLGFGPDICLERNPRLLYGRMTGWGQEGPLAAAAGHDINYISVAGVLAHIGRADAPPTPPLNLVGDFGGGAMFLAFGLLCGLYERERSGVGQVIDAAMVDGAAALMLQSWQMRALGRHDDRRGSGRLDSGSFFYDAYETADGSWISIGSIEPLFFQQLVTLLGLDPAVVERRDDPDAWPQLREQFTEVFRSKSRSEWCDLLEGTDVCFGPVLTMSEAAEHPHNVHRATFVEAHGYLQPAPAPRFSRTPGALETPPSHPGEHSVEVLKGWLSLSEPEIDGLREVGGIV